MLTLTIRLEDRGTRGFGIEIRADDEHSTEQEIESGRFVCQELKCAVEAYMARRKISVLDLAGNMANRQKPSTS